MNVFDKLKLRTKLIYFFILAIIIIGLASLYMYLSLKVLTDDATELFESNLILTDVYRSVDSLQSHLDQYLTANDSDDLLAFYDDINTLNHYAASLQDKAANTRQFLGLINTSQMIANYILEAEATIIYKRRLDNDRFASSYQLTKAHQQQIKSYIEATMSTSLIESTERYNTIAQRIALSTYINGALTLAVFVLIVFLIVGFSREVTRPLSQLAAYSEDIAHGNYDIELLKHPSNDEIGVLYESFGYMAKNIRASIKSLQEKVRLEQTLASERLHLLEVQSALKEAELSALQAQVNPHFMFNTLNIGAKIAQLNNDPTVSKYIENTAALFRYNLKGLDQPATIQEELDNAMAYLSLLKTRFGDLIDYYIERGDNLAALSYQLPRMTIQPLVENAYIHGLSDVEEGGYIKLKVTENADYYLVIVQNSGKPFDTRLMHNINQTSIPTVKRSPSEHHGHTTGIGLRNLIQRLSLFTKQQRVLTVSSQDGYTTVTLLLPKTIESEGDHV